MKTRLKGKLVIITLIMLVLFVTNSERLMAVSIRVAPERFIFDGDQPVTKEVNVMNASNQTIRVRVYTGPAAEQAEEQYLGDWIVVYPPQLSIGPGERRVVRFSLRPPAEVEDGEYRSILYFEEQPRSEEETEDESEEQDDVQIDFQLLTRMGINLYGQFGELDYAGQLEDLELEKDNDQLLLTCNFINQSNAHLRMNVEAKVRDEDENIVKEHSSNFVVHRSEENTFQRSLNLEETLAGGEVELIFKQDDQVIEEKEVSF
ncbi:fimbrial biogenesis chaperone [Fuchsiella alkaliacetigena]|uniref:fimbrial biogenesis chaperone n=1 Tax=Fuchsiella alkaliacetigena TaxID=957042 RepID=UPI00200AAE73|nr:fimbria/pilus periplasmic chaperone [Fuchsiella alkaliacetigena]MCK8824763.1 fimbria/pilus periplasmic chaperone [Fuchsiella alkaliacetigena]